MTDRSAYYQKNKEYLRDDPELLAMAAQWVFSHRPMVAA